MVETICLGSLITKRGKFVCNYNISHSNMELISNLIQKNLTGTMKTICEVLTADPEGGAARINFQLFKDLYTYLAQIDGEISAEHIQSVINHLQYDVYVSNHLSTDFTNFTVKVVFIELHLLYDCKLM